MSCPIKFPLFCSISNLVDVFGDGARNDFTLGVCVGCKASFGLLIEVKHDYLRLVLDFIDAVADLLQEINVFTCLLECFSDFFVENISICSLI